ncbi:MAG: Protein YeeZ [Candidatus Erwinia impunctatus]|nr:Protein YeeZ [Culicoides impunctatus]
MKRVSIIGLGWLGMPLGLTLAARGWQVQGSRTTPDGVEAARLCGLAGYQLVMTPELICQPEALDALMQADALVITLPATRTVSESGAYLSAVQQLVDSARAYHIPHIIFTSSTSVYGQCEGGVDENHVTEPQTTAGKTLVELESWLHGLPDIKVDVLRLAGLVGPQRHPGRFLAGRQELTMANQAVNLVHLDDVIEAIATLLESSRGGHVYNLCAPHHPSRGTYYPRVALQLGLTPPEFLPAENESTGKIVDGNRICRELGFTYKYSDLYVMSQSS